MNRSIAILGLAGLLTCVMGLSAQAAIEAVGSPMDGGSWGQRFLESGVGTYSLMGVRMVSPSPDTFEAPVFRNFSVTNWTTSPMAGYPLGASASGPNTSYAEFDIWFEGLKSEPLQFDFVAFNSSGVLLENVLATWNGSYWTFSTSTWNPTVDEVRSLGAVPEPATLAIWSLLGLVGVSLGVMRRRGLIRR